MKHEFQLAYNSGVIRGSLIPVLAITLFGVFVLIAIFNTFMTSKEYTAEIINKDIKKIAVAIEKIEKDCKILNFASKKNVINFLNVKAFVGSEVGPVNLKHPEKWQGPYLQDNPTLQGIEYLLVVTKKGYFVTPGEGVKLPNGKVIGTDIKFDKLSDIAAMMVNDDQLRCQGKAMAVQVEIKKRKKIVLPTSSIENAI